MDLRQALASGGVLLHFWKTEQMAITAHRQTIAIARQWLYAVLMAVVLFASASVQSQSTDVCVISRVEGTAVIFELDARRHKAEPGFGLGRYAALRTESD